MSWQIILLPFLLVIPGYLISKILKLENEVAYGIGISVSLSILIGLLLGFAKLFYWFAFWPLLLAITGILWWKAKPELEWKYDWKQTTALLLTVLFVMFTLYSTRAEEKYPQHFDEWQNLEIAKDIVEQGNINFLDSNTEFEETNHDRFNRNLEIGFNMLLVEMDLVGFDLVFDQKFFPAIFSLCALAGIFAFIYTLTGSLWATLPAMLLYPAMKTNIMLLGPELFVPITIAFGFILLFFDSFIKFYQGSKTHYYLTYLFAFTLVIIHAPSITFAIPVIALFVLMDPALLRKNYGYLLIYLGIAVLGVLAISIASVDRGGLGFVLGKFIFERGWMEGVDVQYSLLELATIPVYIFALFGAIYCIRKVIYLPIAWAVGCLILYFLYHQLGWTLFSPYHRLLHYLALSIFMLAAIGIYEATKLASKKKKLMAAWVVLIIIPTLIHAYTLEDRLELQYVDILMDDDFYAAINWTDNNLGHDNVVVIDHPKAWSLNSISRNKVSERQFEYSIGGKKFKIYTCFEKSDVIITKKTCHQEEVFRVKDVKVYNNKG